MEMILDELSSGLPDAQQFTRVVIRMLAAALLGCGSGRGPTIWAPRSGGPARFARRSASRLLPCLYQATASLPERTLITQRSRAGPA